MSAAPFTYIKIKSCLYVSKDVWRPRDGTLPRPGQCILLSRCFIKPLYNEAYIRSV